MAHDRPGTEGGGDFKARTKATYSDSPLAGSKKKVQTRGQGKFADIILITQSLLERH